MTSYLVLITQKSFIMTNARKRRRMNGVNNAKSSQAVAAASGQPEVQRLDNTVKVKELSADVFRSEIESDTLSMIPAIADLLDDLPLQYVWDVDKVGLTIVIKPKEEVIDPARLVTGMGEEEEEEELSSSVNQEYQRPDDEAIPIRIDGFDDGNDEDNSALDYEDSNGIGRSGDSSNSFDILRSVDKKVNLDDFAPYVCDESKPLQTPWQKAQVRTTQEQTRSYTQSRAAVGREL